MKLVIIFSLLRLAYSLDYCQLEKKFCAQFKHISCPRNTNVWNSKQNLTIMELTKSSKKHFLNEYNSYRNELASGQIKGYQSSTNMRLMNWFDEFEYLAKKIIAKETNNEHCASTEESTFPREYLFNLTGTYTTNEILTLGFDHLRNSNFEKKNKNFILAANNHQIGCAYAVSMKENVPVHILLCLMNHNKYETLQIYKNGVKCSNCYDWAEECNEVYTGLCGASQIIEYRLVRGPAGERGGQGMPGMISEDFKTDSLYWFLYVILLIGVVGSFYLHFRKIRGLAPFKVNYSYNYENQTILSETQ